MAEFRTAASKIRDGHRATCSCGWGGTFFKGKGSYQNARTERDAHKEGGKHKTPIRLEWDEAGLRATHNGVSYALGSEDTLGRHGGRVWYVYVYEDAGQPASYVLGHGEVWSKAMARRKAQADAIARSRGVKR